MTAQEIHQIRAGLLGAWRLVSWQIIGRDGAISYPLGADAVGQLMYDGQSDRVSAQLVRAGQRPFASDDWQKATTDEMCAAWPSYFGYFGTFTVDAEAVVHHIDAGWFPNLFGTDQIRHHRREGGRLVLDADTAWGMVRIVWEKAESSG